MNEEEFFTVSSPVAPSVAYALKESDDRLDLIIRVGAIGDEKAKVQVGLEAGLRLELQNSDAIVTRGDRVSEFHFNVPLAKVAAQRDDLKNLRFAFAVAWPGGPFGQDRLRERFLHRGGAPSAVLSRDPADWEPFDLTEHAAAVEHLKNRLFVDFQQPMEGKGTVVIEDGKGVRVRNLVSGQALAQGPQHLEWDGLDEKGNVVAPGTYRWRALSHPGITPDYLFSFYNHGKPAWHDGSPTGNWLADHSDPVAAAASDDRVYLGAPVAESGENIVQLTLSGEKTHDMKFPILVGVGKFFLLADDQGCYAVMEGTPAYEPFQDLPNGQWQFRRPLNILRYDLNGEPVKYDGARGEKVVTENMYQGSGPHLHGTKVPDPDNLSGAAILKHVIYLSLKQENRVLLLDAATGHPVGEIPVPMPGMIAPDGSDLLLVFSGRKLLRIDPATRATTPLFSPELSARPTIGDAEVHHFYGDNPTGMAISTAGDIFFSDNGVDQNIKVYGIDGKLRREIGVKGGRAPNGPWNHEGIAQPHGLAIDVAGKLWVAETQTYPRRISVWEAATGKYVNEFLGPNHYGSPEAAFDAADHTTWITGGLKWKLDFEHKTAVSVSTLYHQTKPGQLQTLMMGLHWDFYHRDGRTFLIGFGKGQCIYEILADGSAKLWAFCGLLSDLAQDPRWTLARSIVEAPPVMPLLQANANASKIPVLMEPFGSWGDRVIFDERLIKNISVLWVDRNGDGLGQPEEFEALPGSDDHFYGGWGVGNPTLDLNMPAAVGGKTVILRFKADGFLSSGAPNLSLAQGIAAAVPLDPGTIAPNARYEAIQDRFGREILNSSPMRGLAVDGHTEWTFANNWSGVHGSHEAPLPAPGVMQGVLFFLGTAPLDAKSEVMVMNGNHGRFFLMTTDGMYIDEIFKDTRVTQIHDAYLIGGECFGGFFARGEDGKYYLQSGHTDTRIFQINGLDKIVRTEGLLTVNPAQALAAQTNAARKVAGAPETKSCSIAELPADAKSNPRDLPPSAMWGDPRALYPYAQVRAVRVVANLQLFYHVKDPSPWQNHGSDWTLLFKTGDSIDFQFSTDARAKVGRNAPAPGDKRLLIAPFQGEPIAVLYDYVAHGSMPPMSFSSPSRTELVGTVTQLNSAVIKVVPGDDFYDVAVTIPLADLGLPAAGQSTELLGDFGVIYGDAAGTENLLRSYWSNRATGLINDIPGEVAIAPKFWSALHFQATPSTASP